MMSDYRIRSCVQAHQPRRLAWMSSRDFGHLVSMVSLKPRARERWALERCPSLLRRPAPRHWLTNVPRGTRCPCSRLRPWSYGRAGLTAVAQSQTPTQSRTDAQHRSLTTVSNPHSVSDWNPVATTALSSAADQQSGRRAIANDHLYSARRKTAVRQERHAETPGPGERLRVSSSPAPKIPDPL